MKKQSRFESRCRRFTMNSRQGNSPLPQAMKTSTQQLNVVLLSWQEMQGQSCTLRAVETIRWQLLCGCGPGANSRWLLGAYSTSSTYWLRLPMLLAGARAVCTCRAIRICNGHSLCSCLIILLRTHGRYCEIPTESFLPSTEETSRHSAQALLQGRLCPSIRH